MTDPDPWAFLRARRRAHLVAIAPLRRGIATEADISTFDGETVAAQQESPGVEYGHEKPN